MKFRLFFLFHLMLCSYSYGQQNVTVQFLDAATDAPLAHVNIIDKYGANVAYSDVDGNAILSAQVFSTQKYLLAIYPGYTPDTIYTLASRIYLRRPSVTLKEAVVSSNKVSRLLRLTSEYVVDYDFVGDQFIAATYSGDNGGKAKIFLLDNDGVILASCKVPEEPVQLFKSCIGIYYCVCKDRFYPLIIDTDKIALAKPHNIDMLLPLQQCEFSIKGNNYYRMSNREDFSVAYTMIPRGDTVFKPIEKFEEQDVAKASFEEYLQILDLLEHYQFAEAARLDMQRQRWDRGSFAHINMPILSIADSLVIFDFFKKRIEYYDLAGTKIGSNGIGFSWNDLQLFEIIKDNAERRFYIHRYNNKSLQLLEGLDIHTGQATGDSIAIEKPFAEKVKVHNGRLYYLWQDSHTPATRQLFTQRF